MVTRVSKLLLAAAIAFFCTLVVFNNLTDFNFNYQFVRHVLAMDTVSAASHGHWRAIARPAAHLTFYIGIIGWEALTVVLLWCGCAPLFRSIRQPATAFNAAKRLSIMGLVASLLMWLVAFLSVGGEWFLMWQSPVWNGQEVAFRMFVVVGLVLLIVLQPDADVQP